MELVEDVLGQRDITAEVRMLGVVEERSSRMPCLLTASSTPRAVDQQHGSVSRGHLPVRPSERPRAAQGHAVVLPGFEIMPTGPIPVAGPLEQTGQPIMGLGEFGMSCDQLAIQAHRLGRVFPLEARALRDRPGEGDAFGPGCLGSQAPTGSGR